MVEICVVDLHLRNLFTDGGRTLLPCLPPLADQKCADHKHEDSGPEGQCSKSFVHSPSIDPDLQSSWDYSYGL